MKAAPLHPDIEMIQIVANALGPLKDQVVFVGGATTTLYIDDPAAPTPVATQDVDCVVELSNLFLFTELEKKLRKLGFKQPVAEPNPPICRWGLGEIVVDIMPSDPKILGFSNPWYPEGIAHKEARALPNGSTIFIFSLPFFVGTKLEAVKNRAGNDLRFSHDLEDIVLVLSGSSNASKDLSAAPQILKNYLKKEFGRLLKDPLFSEAVSGTLAIRNEDAKRADNVIALIRQLP